MKNLILSLAVTISTAFTCTSSFAAINGDSAKTILSNNTCFYDATIKTYAKCFYVSFSAVCADGITHTGYIGSTCTVGTPNVEGLKIYIAMQIGCIPNCVTIKERSNISNAEYTSFFAGNYGHVIVLKKK